MPTRHLLAPVMLIVALMGTVEAGTKKPPAKAPTEPIDQMLAAVKKSDPKGLIVAELRFYPGIPIGKATDDLQIIVTNDFHRAHYQERYQLTQLWAAA